MADIKYIDISEFRKLGFLQEANRQFFHPHGLALEVTVVEEPVSSIALEDEDVEALRLLCVGNPRLIERLDEAVRYATGDAYISGCWDYRDDPEGVVFGGPMEDKRTKADRVAAQREKHRDRRAELFGVATDIEPIEWLYDEGGADA